MRAGLVDPGPQVLVFAQELDARHPGARRCALGHIGNLALRDDRYDLAALDIAFLPELDPPLEHT